MRAVVLSRLQVEARPLNTDEHLLPNGDGWKQSAIQTSDESRQETGRRPELNEPAYGMNSNIFSTVTYTNHTLPKLALVLHLSVLNLPAAEFFKEGAEYYVDFSAADAPTNTEVDGEATKE